MTDSREVWGSSSRDYAKNTNITVDRLFEEDGESYTLSNTVKALFPSGYKPDLDVKKSLGQSWRLRTCSSLGFVNGR